MKWKWHSILRISGPMLTILILYVAPAWGAPWLRFTPRQAQPGQEVHVRTIGHGAFGDQGGHRFGLYLQDPEVGKTLVGATFLGRLRVTRQGDGIGNFSVPRIPPGKYSVIIECPPCRPFSAGRRLLVAGTFTVLESPVPPSPEEGPSERANAPESSAGNPLETIIGLIGIVLSVALLTSGIRKHDISTRLKTLLSVLEAAVLLVSVVLFGWLGFWVFGGSLAIALLITSLRLAIEHESLLVSAAVESNRTKEEMTALYERLKGSHTAFQWLGPIGTAKLIWLLAQRARAPDEIESMALPIAMLLAAFRPGEIEHLVEKFDRLMRLAGEPASRAMKVADSLTTGTQAGAATFNEMLDAMIAVYEP